MGRKKKKRTIKIPIEIRVALITSITSILVAYFAYNFWEQKKIKDQFIFNQYNSDYFEGNKYFEKVSRSYDNLMNYLTKNSGLTEAEISPFIDSINTQVNEFKYYTRRVEMYGTQEQISITNEVLKYLTQGWSDLEIHKRNIQLIEKEIRYVNLQKDKDIERLEKMYSDFDNLIYSENRLYFNIRENYIPILENLQQIFIGTFRERLDLKITKNIVEASIKLDKLLKSRDTFQYKRKKIEYRFAKVRSLSSHQLITPNDSIMLRLNEMDKMEMFSKYLMSSVNGNNNVKTKKK